MSDTYTVVQLHMYTHAKKKKNFYNTLYMLLHFKRYIFTLKPNF